MGISMRAQILLLVAFFSFIVIKGDTTNSVQKMSLDELDALIYKTYMMYQQLERISKM